MIKGTLFLMYHELQLPGAKICLDDPGYLLYVVSRDNFSEQLSVLRANGWRGRNVTEALQSLVDGTDDADPTVCFTFDDGCATDLLVAAPLLREKGFNATFYVTVNHLGQPGYLTQAQLRMLSDLGFEIGSHSMTHRHFNDLGSEELLVELFESKKQLEQITGRPVVHFSCPGGRVNSLIDKIARDCGYESVATSRVGVNSKNTDWFALTRVPVKRGTSAARLERLCRGEGLFFSQAQNAILSAAKHVLGNSMYERVRSGVLR